MSKTSVKLSAKWQLDAALLSRPVDLTPLVAMSRTHPDNFLEDKTLHRLVQLLNEANENKSNRVRTAVGDGDHCQSKRALMYSHLLRL